MGSWQWWKVLFIEIFYSVSKLWQKNSGKSLWFEMIFFYEEIYGKVWLFLNFYSNSQSLLRGSCKKLESFDWWFLIKRLFMLLFEQISWEIMTWQICWGRKFFGNIINQFFFCRWIAAFIYRKNMWKCQFSYGLLF